MLVVLLRNGHTDAEKTLREAGHLERLLEGRQVLQSSIEDELKDIVQQTTGRGVVTVLSCTRLDPDLSAEIFLLEEHVPLGDEQEFEHRAHRAHERAEQLARAASAVSAQARQAVATRHRRK